MSTIFLVLLAVAAWLIIYAAAYACGRAAARPWPEHTQRFRRITDDEEARR